MKKAFLSAVLLCLISFPAKAVFIEPFVGYGTGTLDFTASSLFTFSESVDLKGPNYGLRAGFEPGNFQLGAEYLLGNFKTSKGDTVEEDVLKTQEISAFIGYRFWYMRLYTALIVSAKDTDSGLSGEGFKGGLSFYPFKNLALNLEYRTVELLGEQGGFLIDANYDVLGVFVSFPFSF